MWPLQGQSQSERVRLDKSLNEGESKFVKERMVTVEKSLKNHGIQCESKNVPRIAVLGSGGGERAMIGLLGCIDQMYNENLLDSILYLCGVSGSTWCMTSMYEEPDWTSKVPSVKADLVKRLTETEVDVSELIGWLSKAADDEHFSLTDFWSATVVYGFVKKINSSCLSDLKTMEAKNPYPIFTVNDQGLKEKGDEISCWFELTPHETGYSHLGAFVDTTSSRSQFEAGVLKQKTAERDMLYLQGLCGSALADGEENVDHIKNSIWQWLRQIFQTGKEEKAKAAAEKKQKEKPKGKKGRKQKGKEKEIEKAKENVTKKEMDKAKGAEKGEEKGEKEKKEETQEGGSFFSSIFGYGNKEEEKKEEGGSFFGSILGYGKEEKEETEKAKEEKEEEGGSFFSRMLGYGNEEEEEEDEDEEDEEEGGFFSSITETFFDYVPLDDMASDTLESILNIFDCDDEEENTKHVEKMHKSMSDANPEKASKLQKKMVGKSKEEKEQSLIEYALDAFGTFQDYLPGLSSATKITLKTMSLLSTWTWGTKHNFLYKFPLTESKVPEEVLSDEHTYLEDAGLVLNSPYVAALRPERNVNFILSFDFSAGDPFLTVTQAAEHCMRAGIPFPPVEIPEGDRKQPKDFYVFKSENAPTVIHIPLFNMVNCEGDVQKWREEYTTFRSAYDRETMDKLIRVSGLNVKNNKEKIIQEIAALCK